MANQSNTSELVSSAWNLQREGRASAAVTEFQKLVQQHPKDIDANYGLALAQKTSGQVEDAIRTFKNTLELIEDSKKSYEASRVRNPEQDNIKTPEDDRFQMLSRMVNQRLAELQKASKS
jgi:DNA-binding SARP family transcriptional activator